MSILVTGSAGFIGSHVCERLLESGQTVVGLDNYDPYYSIEIKNKNTAVCTRHPNFQFVEGDIRDTALVERLFQEHTFSVVIHLAAKAGVRPSLLQPLEYVDVNLRGTTNLLEAAQKTGVKRFLFASSSSVYGNQDKVPFSETDDVGFPISPYAATKRSGELICHSYHHLYQMEIACLRFFTVYGPRQRPDLAIHKFTHLALENLEIPIYGDGKTRRDYTYIDDIVDGIQALVNTPQLDFQLFNLGNGHPVHLLDMVDALEHALDKKLELNFIDKQPGDVDQTHADVRKASAYFDYQPKVSLREGVKRFVEWYRKNPS
jgi:UDP-glucuronate 4-epimerase